MLPRSLFPSLGPWTSVALEHGLAGLAAVPESPLADEIDLICEQKLAPLLLHFVRTTGAPIGELLRRRLEDDTAARVAHMARTSRLGTVVEAELHAAGVPVVIMKGAGLARHYRWPWARTSTDIDVLIDPTQFSRAFALMRGRGWQELARSRQPWPVFNRWCRESVNLVAAPTTSVDLHHRVSPWLWSDRLNASAVRASSQRGQDGVHVACGADNLAVAALQLVGEHREPGSKLIAWRDIAELGAALEPAQTALRLHQTGTAGTVGWLLTQLPPSMRPTRLMRLLPVEPSRPHRLELMIAAARHERALAAHILRLPLPRAAVFLAGTLFPSRSFLLLRFGGTSHRRRAWWRSMVDFGGLPEAAAAIDRGGNAPEPVVTGLVVDGELRVRDGVVDGAGDHDGVIVTDRATAERLVISRSGVPLWHALTRGATTADLAKVLVAVHGLTPELATDHALAFVSMLVDRGLLEPPTRPVV